MAEESKIKLSKTRIERKCGMGDKNPLRMKGGHSEKTKQYLIEVRGSKVLQYNSQGEFIQEYRSTHDCSGFVQVSVARCCRGEI